MTTFKAGDRCRVAEVAPRPLKAREYPAEVEEAGTHYATARVNLGDSGTALWAFDQGTGRGATRELIFWRLEPVNGEDAATAAEGGDHD